MSKKVEGRIEPSEDTEKNSMWLNERKASNTDDRQMLGMKSAMWKEKMIKINVI